MSSTSTILADIARVQAACTSGRVWFEEILPTSDGTEDTGTSGRATLDATNAAILAALGNRFIPRLSYLQSQNDGSANDLADVAAGRVPRSLHVAGDNFHMSRPGNFASSRRVINHIETYGP